MYKFLKTDDLTYILGDSSREQFVELIKRAWDRIHDETDAFRYKLDRLQEKTLDNMYLLQLNPDRSTKRRQPESIDSVVQPFDGNKFNFTMVPQREILFNMVKEGKESDVHALIVNVSPISRYHTLLCPSVTFCLPQVATIESLEVVLDIMFLAHDRDLRIGFNGLCALASVNHLHYHLFWESNTLPIEKVKCKHIKGPLFCLKDYPISAFCFQINTTEEVGQTCRDVYKLLKYLLGNSVAHNLMITRGNGLLERDKEVLRVVIWPRKSSAGQKQLDAFNVAVLEMSGWFPVYDEAQFQNLRSENLECELRRWEVDNFDLLCEEVEALF